MTDTIERRLFLAGLASSAVMPMLVSARAKAAESRTLVGVIEEDPPVLNPAVSSTISSFVVAVPVYSALTRMDVDGKISGDLAEGWDVSPDGLTYTFHLRPDIAWHDGRPFSSADVVFSLEQVNSKLHPYRGALKAISTYEAPDARTVVLRLGQPQGSLVNTLHNYAGCILPKHLWEGTDILKNPHMTNPVGTGAYKFVEFLPGDRITLARNETYFLPGKPGFDEIVFRIIPDAAARVAAFENGELDMIYQSALPPTQVERLKRLPGVKMKPSKVSIGGFLGYINMRNAPYDDVRVRRAIAHAIDKSFVRQTVFSGLADNMVGPLPSTSPLYNKALVDYAYDPARANALLDEAGLTRDPEGTRFSFRYVYSVNELPAAKIGDIVAQNLKLVGIKTVLTPLERGSYLQRVFAENQFDMAIAGLVLGPDPDVAIERLYNSNNITGQPFSNNSPYRNPQVDALFDQQRSKTDLAARKAVYDKIQELIWTDVPIIPICVPVFQGAIRESYALGVFEEDSTNREDFYDARPAKS